MAKLEIDAAKIAELISPAKAVEPAPIGPGAVVTLASTDQLMTVERVVQFGNEDYAQVVWFGDMCGEVARDSFAVAALKLQST